MRACASSDSSDGILGCANIELCIFCGGLAHFLKTVARLALIEEDLSAWSLKCAHLELRSVKGIDATDMVRHFS